MQKCLASTIAHLQRTYSPSSLSPSISPSRPRNYKHHKPHPGGKSINNNKFFTSPYLPPSTYR